MRVELLLLEDFHHVLFVDFVAELVQQFVLQLLQDFFFFGMVGIFLRFFLEQFEERGDKHLI